MRLPPPAALRIANVSALAGVRATIVRCLPPLGYGYNPPGKVNPSPRYTSALPGQALDWLQFQMATGSNSNVIIRPIVFLIIGAFNPSGYVNHNVDTPLSRAWHVLWGPTGTPWARADGWDMLVHTKPPRSASVSPSARRIPHDEGSLKMGEVAHTADDGIGHFRIGVGSRCEEESA